jgi:hypothetical protein
MHKHIIQMHTYIHAPESLWEISLFLSNTYMHACINT